MRTHAHLLAHTNTRSCTHTRMRGCTHTHTHSLSHTHSLTLAHSLTHSHTLARTRTHSDTHSLAHALTRTRTHSHTHSLAHVPREGFRFIVLQTHTRVYVDMYIHQCVYSDLHTCMHVGMYMLCVEGMWMPYILPQSIHIHFAYLELLSFIWSVLHVLFSFSFPLDYLCYF